MIALVVEFKEKAFEVNRFIRVGTVHFSSNMVDE